MASFTDKAPTFNPYVQQQPVEAMVKVGMQKQQQYDQGLEKIQESFNRIGGLDIIKDNDKAYLESKMAETTSKLRGFAAGDFSNSQLVNSVSGMIGSVANDKNVQNAVASTNFFRKENARIELDRASGKENPANTTHFQKKASQWLSSDVVGESFNGRYVPPTDVWKKIQSIAKEVGVDEQTVQELFQTDANGQRVLDENGNPKWNSVMVEKTLKGKDAGKVLNAFKMGLNSQDYQQLAIEGEYRKAGDTPEMLKEEIARKSEKQINKASETMKALQVAMINESAKAAGANTERLQSLQTQLEFFTKQHNTLTESRDNNMKNVDINPDAVRASLYTNDFLTNMSSTLSSQEVSTKYSVSPYHTITLENNEFARKVQNDKVQRQQWAATHAESIRSRQSREASDKAKLEFDYLKETGALTGSGGNGEMLDGTIQTTDVPTQISRFKDSYVETVGKVNENNMAITRHYFEKLEGNEQAPGESNSAYRERISKLIDKDARSRGTTVRGQQGDDQLNEYTAQFAAKQIAVWTANENGVPNDFKELFETQFKLRDEMEQTKQIIEEKSKQARAIAARDGVQVPSEEEIRASIQPTSVTVDGQRIDLTKQDIMDYALLHPEIGDVVDDFFGGAITSFFGSKADEVKRAKARERITQRHGKNSIKIEEILFNKNLMPDGSRTDNNFQWRSHPYYQDFYRGGNPSPINAMNPELEKARKLIQSSNYEKLAEIETQLYIDDGMVPQPKQVLVVQGKEKDQDFFGRLSMIAGIYTDNLNEVEGYDTQAMQKHILDTKGSGISFNVQPGMSPSEPPVYRMDVIGSDGKLQSVQVNEQQYQLGTNLKPFKNQQTPLVISKLNANGTTNTNGGRPDGAHFSNSNFTKLEKNIGYTLSGDYIDDKYNPNKVWLQLYKHNDDGSIDIIPVNSPLVKYNADNSFNTQLTTAPSQITDAAIQALLNPKK